MRPVEHETDVLAIDNVRLELPIAGVGSRILAATVDYVLLALLMLLWLGLITIAVVALDLASAWVLAALVVGLFLLHWGYFVALEILLDGQTAGKRLLGLRVVSLSGGRASAGAIIIRGLLRSIDTIVGIALVMYDRRARRLGDLVAGTLVVHTGVAVAEERLLARLPRGWGGAEAAVVESFLRRADLLEPSRAEHLAARLLRLIARHDPAFGAGVAPAGGPAPDALGRLRALFAAAPPAGV